MTIIIAMAGKGSRFLAAGYQEPKYKIQAKGKTLFEWSMDSLLGFRDVVTKYVFIVRKEDNAEAFIKEKCLIYQISEYKIIELEYPTDGQATTCLYGIRECDKADSVLIYNIDTYVEPYQMKAENIHGDGFIPCFEAEGNHWSFVEVDDAGKAVCVREKERISNNCSIGAYYFKSGDLYKTLYEEYYNNDGYLVNNEKYVAPLYNLMILQNMDVRIQKLERSKVHVLGTPEELAAFMEGR